MLRSLSYAIGFLLMLSFTSCDSEEDLVSEQYAAEPTVASNETALLEQEQFSDLLRDRLALSSPGKHYRQGCGCVKVLSRLSSSGEVNPPLLTTNGQMRGTLRGETYFEANLGNVVGIGSELDNDPASFFGTLRLTNRRGTLTFRDVGALEQVPNGLGTSFSRVVEGTGSYSGASGFLFLNLIADDTGLNFDGIVRGETYCGEHSVKLDGI